MLRSPYFLFSISLVTLSLTGCGAITMLMKSAEVPQKTVQIPLAAENYIVEYDGHGSVDFNAADISIAPQVSTSSTETHSALVFIKQTVDTPVQDFELTVDLEVTQQLRQNTAANDWEVFWLFFNYKGSSTEKTTNYFMSKPGNGSELGFAHGEIGQKFISTDAPSTTAVGARHIFKYSRVGSKFTVYRDGTLFYSFTDSSSFPQKLYSTKGAIGFYSEDAQVKIYSVSLKRLDSTTSTPVLPVLTGGPLVRAPSADSALSVSVSNFAQRTSLFWSCAFKSLTGDLTAVVNRDCLNLGALSTDGTLSWTPSFQDVGSWFFKFEVSEVLSGFSNRTTYLQVRPTWTSNQQLFLYDPQFSISKTIDSQNVLVSRDLTGAENNKTAAWPDLTSADTMDLSGLSEATPWLTDADTQLAALHFDANHDIQGLPLPVSGLGTTQDIRLSYWFKRDNTDSKAALLVNHTNGTLQSRHWFGVISSTYTDGGSAVDCYDPNPATSDWTFVTTQVVSGVLKTYVNGREVCSQNLPATYNFSSPLRVAPKVETFFPFAGRLSEIAGYKTSTAAEILSDFTATADRYRVNAVGPIQYSDLVLHWDMANAEIGMRAPSSANVFSLFELGPYNYSKIIGGFDGTVSSGYLTAPAAKSALVFDGTDDYIQINSDPHLSLGPTWTIEAWLQPGVALGNDNGFPANDLRYPLFKTIFEKAFYDMPNKLCSGFGLRIGATNTVDAYVINNYGNTDTIQGLTSLTANQWYHVAVSFDKPTARFKVYVNGVLESTNQIDYLKDSNGTPQSDGDILAGASDAFIGIPFDVDGRRRFNGKLGALRVYQNALSEAQVKANCNAQGTRFSVTCN